MHDLHWLCFGSDIKNPAHASSDKDYTLNGSC